MIDKEVLEKVIEMLEEMKDVAMEKLEPEKGKISWPIKEGDCLEFNDAYATLYSLSEAELGLTFFDVDGNTLTYELFVDFSDCYTAADAGLNSFARVSLKKMLKEELQLYIDEDNVNSRRGQLLTRLVKAFEEPA